MNEKETQIHKAVKTCLYFLLSITLSVSCKKKEDPKQEPEPTPAPVVRPYQTVNLTFMTKSACQITEVKIDWNGDNATDTTLTTSSTSVLSATKVINSEVLKVNWTLSACSGTATPQAKILLSNENNSIIYEGQYTSNRNFEYDFYP